MKKPLVYRPLVLGALGILLSILAYYLVPDSEYPKASLVAAMVVLMAFWWVFEVVPIAVTSLFPLILLPIMGVANMQTVGAYYGRPIIFLFLGGFLLALALEKSKLHKRIALHIVSRIGSKPSSLVLGFMIASGFLSMWISNTASVLVMMPIGLSILSEVRERNIDPAIFSSIGVTLMLGIAYAADMGGMATIIGTPPNLVFLELFQQIFPAAPEVGFLQWMLIGLPLSIVFLFMGWVLLTRFIYILPKTQLMEGKSIIDQQIRELGPVRWDEKWAGGVFGLAAILWMTGSDIQIGDAFTLHGWRTMTGLTEASDAVVAIATACILFIIPSKDDIGEPIMDWNTALKVPWGILLLFGGGLAMAGGFQMSGLSEVVGRAFTEMEIGSPITMIIITNTFTTFLTELTSNTAMANLLLPILGKASVVLQLDPRLLMIPATLSASCAFMMPIASPTQAIIFGSGYVSIRQMVRAGIWFNILGIILVTLVFVLLGDLILGIDLNQFPTWAE